MATVLSPEVPAKRAPYGGKTSKAARTRAHILEVALGLFRSQGYDSTTMRAIAKAAGVSAGNAYYYFPTKEHLVQGFYARSHAEHLAAARPAMEAARGLEARLLAAINTKFDTARDYHAFAGGLFKTAADPASPLSPFSEASAPTRLEAIELMEEVLQGTRIRTSSALYSELPHLLWLYLMGLILFWVHDGSEGQARTYRLASRTVPVVSKLIRLGSNPLLSPLVKSIVKLMRELREPVAIGSSPSH
ncbi:MAG: TetR family transcriptional regulator [Planctomycetota bacterium]